MKFITVILVLFFSVISVNAGLKESAHDAFIAGEYEKALLLYDSLSDVTTSRKRVHALQMKASIYEEYLGEIDSALIIYNQILNESSDSRLNVRTQKRIKSLNALGDQKLLFGIYQRTLVSRIDSKDKITAFEKILKESPDFIKNEEILRLLTPLYHDEGHYIQANRILQKRIAEFGPVDDELKTSTERYARREYLHYLSVTTIIAMTIIVIALFPRYKREILPQIKPLLFTWFLITLVFSTIYYVKIADGFYNPFKWYSPWILMGLNLLPIVWLTLFNQMKKGRVFSIGIGVLPAIFSFVLLFQIFLYSHKTPMDLMDTFTDRQLELFTSEDLQQGDPRGED